jgi:putative restriction endonuclease
MTKAVFIQSSHSSYADRPGEIYQFPKARYLRNAERVIGDWVVFYEGRRGDNRGYYATQRLEAVAEDPNKADYALAILDRASLIDFPHRLAHKRASGETWETGLPDYGGKNTSSVRLLSDSDFARMIDAAFMGTEAPEALARVPGFADEQVPFLLAGDRARVLTDRALRDKAFGSLVKVAYGGRCAVSGLELRNGGGRPEVEAAHIVPVEERGPDALSNGLALSGTVHWMFDRGLISANDDGTILVSRSSVADDHARRLIRPEGKLLMPSRISDRPHPSYLRWHRENRFKG